MIRKYKFLQLDNYPAPAPSPSSRFGPAVEVKERPHQLALQRLSGLNRGFRFKVKNENFGRNIRIWIWDMVISV
jgi:hypothetical protein